MGRHLYISSSSIATKDDFRQTTLAELREMPIPDPKKNKKCRTIIDLSKVMLNLHKKLSAAKTGDEKTRLQRQIDATDEQIDQLVYELYGLTKEEIKIIEESLNQ